VNHRSIPRFVVAVIAAGLLVVTASGQPARAPSDVGLVLEPAYNGATPLVGRVRQVGDSGELVRDHLGPQPNDLFGLAAAVLPDIDGDGVDDLAIAAPNAYEARWNRRVGRVYVISGADGVEIRVLSSMTTKHLFGLGLLVVEATDTDPARLRVWYEILNPATGYESRYLGVCYDEFSLPTLRFMGGAAAFPDGLAFADSRVDRVRVDGAEDLNADGAVDHADVDVLLRHFGTSLEPLALETLAGDPTLAAAPIGDLDASGAVDENDLARVSALAGGDAEPASFSTVPAEAIVGCVDRLLSRAERRVWGSAEEPILCDGDEAPPASDGADPARRADEDRRVEPPSD
jgi:hypothetical protein